MQPLRFTALDEPVVVVCNLVNSEQTASAIRRCSIFTPICSEIGAVGVIVGTHKPLALIIGLDAPITSFEKAAIVAARRALPAIMIVGVQSRRKNHFRGNDLSPLEPGLVDRLVYPPLDIGQLVSDFAQAYAAGRERTDLPQSDVSSNNMGLLGDSPVMRELRDTIRRVAATDVPVLISGESGTGKELAALAIHSLSARKHGSFVAINCAGLPQSLISSELFGHEKGAFTGAVARKIGKLEAAKGGTCLLDEIGDFPIDLQGHLLRFLQEKAIERVGATTQIPLDVRIVAASHVDLSQAVAENRFREDLFYRLNVLTIEMPPLRDRGKDIELLSRHFVRSFSAKMCRPKVGLHADTIAALNAYHWPGNVRELIGVLLRAVVLTDGTRVMPSDLNLPGSAADKGRVHTLDEARHEAEEICVRQALLATGANVKRAAQILGVSRNTLYRLAERHAIALHEPL